MTQDWAKIEPEVLGYRGLKILASLNLYYNKLILYDSNNISLKPYFQTLYLINITEQMTHKE